MSGNKNYYAFNKEWDIVKLMEGAPACYYQAILTTIRNDVTEGAAKQSLVNLL